ncbi:hypothetical protein DACRYDRAFT_20015 [Dacryopinax primogenitus]|uniref:Pre-mRNA-splicing factor CEF1 n=1 Tax=Dacryopinax primogenitus (strain DJM 731) TaxID=1858805 RepID=M5GGJ1_DACPD|nr:uncharacterized protein DACRYDRAFT_20015 [Dacryopinax primogenitus]EJU05578.1 hypothetical protein DACRYDRAFT_20015 [Dacryopinax primogenitus]
MVRTIIKGGVWQNTEDEVLKAAIAKYGKNQWARISSLLVRKTPKQCKSRWYEWLDPSIKKTEWSKTEDEKLLHLAKLMPTQWRTIAPIVGRTATQCLERYQKLLDEAEARENEELGLAGPGAEAGPAEDIRKLRPGEIDPDPETKPARPDPIDMDEDEKEMLSEARARLANTQGKKAKRKARERQLEEARRLAMLQKKRELKAAGIIMRLKSKKKGMDYNADIPFEKQPAAGFYDTSEEQSKTYAAPVGQSLRRLEGKRKPEEEEAERKKRQRRDAEKKGTPQHQTQFVAARDAQIQKLKEAEQISKRRQLVLPSAQVGEAELEQIVKIGQAGENARALVAGEGDEASGQLLGEYEGLSQARMARTPRTAPQEDNIMAEARNLRNMTQTQTPLLGEENTPMHGPNAPGTGYEGATPRRSVNFTPNPLATPRENGALDVSATPRTDAGSAYGQTPLRTPMRDSLNINITDDGSVYGMTPRAGRGQLTSAKRSLKPGFMSLPAPKNDFEVMMPEDEEEEEAEDGVSVREEDSAERDARLKRRREEEERKALARRSTVVQKGLPRPPNVNAAQILKQLMAQYSDENEAAAVERLIDTEMVLLMKHDSVAHPVVGTSIAGGTRSTYVQPDDEAIAWARAAVHHEFAESLGFPGANEDQIKNMVVMLSAEEEKETRDIGWSKIKEEMCFDAKTQTWVEKNALSPADRIEGMSALLDSYRDQLNKEGVKAGKAEKKLTVTLGGYQARFTALSKRVGDGFADLQKTHGDLVNFSQLAAQEGVNGPRRLESLREEVDVLERREKSLQGRYQELDEARRERVERIAALEDQLFADAEAANEAAMEEMDRAAGVDVEMA